MLEDIILTSKHPSAFIKPLICSINNGRMWGSTRIDLRNASRNNPVEIPVLDENEAKLTPLYNRTMSPHLIYIVQLADDTETIIQFTRKRNDVYCKIGLTFKKNNHAIRIHQYRAFPLSQLDKIANKIKDRINKLDIFFNNRHKIYNYIDKIALFPLHEMDNDEFTVVDTRYNKGATELPYVMEYTFRGKITVVTPQIVRILDYENVIENLDTVTLEEQYEIARFLRNNFPTKCKYKDFTFTDDTVRFCGVTIVILDKKWPPDVYFKYFRHRGMCFLSRAITKTELLSLVIKQRLKRENVQQHIRRPTDN